MARLHQCLKQLSWIGSGSGETNSRKEMEMTTYKTVMKSRLWRINFICPSLQTRWNTWYLLFLAVAGKAGTFEQCVLFPSKQHVITKPVTHR